MQNRLWVPLLLLLSMTLLAVMGAGIRLALDEQSVVRKRYYFLFQNELELLRGEVDRWRAGLEQDAVQLTEAAARGENVLIDIAHTDSRFLSAEATPFRNLSGHSWPSVQWTQRFEPDGSHFGLRVRSGNVTVRFELNPAEVRRGIERALVLPFRGRSPLLRGILVDSLGRPVARWGAERTADVLDVAALTLLPPFDGYRLQGAVSNGFWSKSFYSQALFTIVPSLLLMILLLSAGVAMLLRKHEQEVRETQERLSFVNRISHELKTPLTNIRLYSELLADRLSQSDIAAEEYLTVIIGESQRLSRFISSVLTYAKGERKELSVVPRPADPLAILESAIERFAPMLHGEDLEIRTSTRGIRNGVVDGDALMQIVGNIVANVQRYAASGRYLSIRARCTQEHLFVRFQDHGPGIPRGMSERIFEPFVCVPSPGNGAQSTGLGLGISRDLARLHGGELRAISAARGAALTLRIRISAAPAVLRAQAQTGGDHASVGL